MLPTRFEYLVTSASKAVVSPLWQRAISAASSLAADSLPSAGRGAASRNAASGAERLDRGSSIILIILLRRRVRRNTFVQFTRPSQRARVRVVQNMVTSR